ncbi:uncharacterized protein BXIN_0241 [Babesia sp. Xinjiang]|uniref:uncharacterized protein n=1 Tax=Babesia sp. Xinjiang TaxID=462227 RepID=UPI000A218BE5|nr:uncharacterized protein BXIN_0241 [Babesia sp. Xinjiang]ORM39615.1 hypothetical protein BXIN_0241 [Babesia sp. Xinjiang]
MCLELGNRFIRPLNPHKAEVERRDNTPVVIDEYEALVTVSDDADGNTSFEKAKEDKSYDRLTYIRDVRNAIGGRVPMDPEKVYTVHATLPVGEMLVLATASGCSLLSNPEEDASGKVEYLEFTFRLADLEDCAKVTDSIITGLQSEIVAAWGSLGGTSAANEVASSTTLQGIGMRTNNQTSRQTSAGDSAMNIGIQDMANAFIAANLEVRMIPTSADGVLVMHFDLNGSASAKEIAEMMANIDMEKLNSLSEAIKAANEKIVNASPEELKQMEDQLKAMYERDLEELRRHVDENKKLLEELSSDGVTELVCSSLALGDCKSVSKCSVVKLNGEETCAVSPKTVFLLMETGCGLQSKAGLMSIVRDIVGSGLMTEENHQTLRHSFDLHQICNAIVHTYMSADISETDQHETKRSFEL